MAVNPKQFEEKPWRKPVRYFKEGIYVTLGKLLRSLGFLKGMPNQPVFIVGSPRSGTSIFNKMISECKDVADFSEAIFVWSPQDKDKNCDHVKGEDDVSQEDEERIKGGFGFYQFIRGKRIFVNKCPRSSVRIPFIQKIFPEAKYIHVYRDGRAVVNSIIDIVEREDFRKDIPLGAFCKPHNWKDLMKLERLECHSHQWKEIMIAIQNDSKMIDKDQWLEVKYEDFCINPSDVMSEVFKFINAEPTEQQLLKIKQMPQKNDQKWRKTFSGEEVSIMNNIMADQLTAYDYKI